MIRRVASILNLLGPVAMTIMGAAISLWPPNPNSSAPIIWIVAFTAVGISTFAAAYILKDDLHEMIMGGKHFCYFKTLLSEAKHLEGPFQLWMVAPKGPVFDLNYWISPAGTTADDPRYGSLDVRKPLHLIIHDGGHAWERSLPLGDYRIEFDGKNGHWMESLQIYVENGKLAQSIKVTGFGGKHLFEEHE